MAIPKIYKHGIEIIKPWSKEMYDYNESIKAIMINEIKFSISALRDEETAQNNGMEVGWVVTDLENIQSDMLNNTENMENYWLAQIWDELIEADFVQPIFGENNEVYNIIGFESPEEIKQLRAKFSN